MKRRGFVMIQRSPRGSGETRRRARLRPEGRWRTVRTSEYEHGRNGGSCDSGCRHGAVAQHVLAGPYASAVVLVGCHVIKEVSGGAESASYEWKVVDASARYDDQRV